jgi:hypothetical protein
MGRTQRAERPASRPEERKSLVELEPRGLDGLLASKEYAGLVDFCTKRETLARAPAAVEAHWLRESEHSAGVELARELRANCDHVVVLGAGGPLLAFRSLPDLRPNPGLDVNTAEGCRLHYLGDGLDESRLVEILSLCESRARVGLLAVSHGPPAAQLSWLFRLIEQSLESRYGDPELLRRIVLLADNPGRALAERAYRQVVVPDQLRTHQLIFTPLGLFGLWLAGVEPSPCCEGIRSQIRASEKMDTSHPAAIYALCRYLLLRESGGRESFLALSSSQQHLAQWWLGLMAQTGLAISPDAGCPTEICLPTGMQLPQSGKGFDVTVEHREASSRESAGDLHESCASLLKQAWSKRSTVGCLGLFTSRCDLFGLGALLVFLCSAAGASQAILSERPDR